MHPKLTMAFPCGAGREGRVGSVFFLLCQGFPFSENVVFSVLFLQLKFRKSRHLTGSFLTLMCPVGEGNGNPLQCSCLENPRTGEPGGLPSLGSQSRTRLKRLSSSSSMCPVVLPSTQSPFHI